MRDVCVIGLGLIGGSVLRAATVAGRKAWGATRDATEAATASAEGYSVGTDVARALREATEREALVVLAVPLPAVDEVLRLTAQHAPDCLLTDVVGVKAPVGDAVARWAPSVRYAGGHPMAGTVESGWAAGNPELFAGATWVVCPDDGTDLVTWRAVAELALDVGATVSPLTAREHDETVARVSHLPHLLAEVLASVGAQGAASAASLAAGSFTDGTRVAHTEPELVRAMTEGNRDALLDVLDEALGKLGAARGSLASTGGLAATINAGYEGTRALAEHRDAPRTGVRLDLTAPQARDGLHALGRRGGQITMLEGDTAVGEAP